MSLVELLLERAVYFIPVLLSLTVHEWAHAWTAWRLGDDTAKMLGRVSLNPIEHIDPLGTLLLQLMGMPFGWAKPVPINPVRFRTSMAKGLLMTAAAGPFANLLLAFGACAALATITAFSSLPQQSIWLHAPAVYDATVQFLQILVVVNVLLACFNLLPIPPLDGSRIVDAVMPRSLQSYWNQFSSLGPLLLAGVIILPIVMGTSILTWPLYWVSKLLEWVTTGL